MARSAGQWQSELAEEKFHRPSLRTLNDLSCFYSQFSL
uniref:Uncharacterized protein n=1 Tax=Anguilla anguilla TaxID=7936 RepID=A0A0E9RWX6_ANGAN